MITIISLGLNAILLTVGGFLTNRLNSLPVSAPVKHPDLIQTAAKSPPITPPPVETGVNQPKQSVWDSIYSEDLRRFHGQLRQVGCPEKTMRDILLPMVEDIYRKKSQAISRSSANSFWQAANRSGAAQRKARWAVESEKSALIRELFGVALDMNALAEWHRQYLMGIALGFLPEGKPEQVLWVAKGLSEEALRIEGLSQGILTPEDSVQMEALYMQAKRDFSSILSPYELEELEARATVAGIAMTLRETLLGLSMNGQEIRSLVCSIISMGNPFLRNILANGIGSKATQANLKAILEERLLAMVGKDRFAEYQRLQNPVYRMLNIVADKFSVPKTKIDTLYQITQAAKEEETNLRKNPDLTPEQRKQAEAQNAQTVEQTARQLLGDKVYEDMKKTRLPR